MTAIVVLIALISVISVSGLYFLLQGDSNRGSAVTAQIQQGLQDLFGPDFDVQLNNANLDFDLPWSLQVTSEDITIKRRSNDVTVSQIGNLSMKVNLASSLSGALSFRSVTISGASLDAGSLGSGQAFFLPPHLDRPLNVMGRELARFQNYLDSESFTRFEILDSVITGPVLGRREESPINVSKLAIASSESGKFSLDGTLVTELSSIELRSSYGLSEDNASVYKFAASGINSREWLRDPEAEDGVVGASTMLEVEGEIPFNSERIAVEPKVTVKSGPGRLRMGRISRTDISELEMNFRLILDRNQIELDESRMVAGRLTAFFIGGVKPADEEAGYRGPLLYDIIMKHGKFLPVLEGEEPVPAAFKMAGIYDSAIKELSVKNIVLTTRNGVVSGSGRIGLEGETPSLQAKASTDGISVAALKQFWPFFVGRGAREWVQTHVIDGWVEHGTVTADIPPGIIFRFRQGKKLKPEHFRTDLQVRDLAFRPFGELPPIQNAVGKVVLSGMKISGEMDKGNVPDVGSEPVQIRTGSFEMADFAAREKFGKASLTLDGDIETLATIADRKPLRVMERMKVTPGQFSGFGHADIVAHFPIKKRPDYDEVNWNVLLDVQNGASSKKIGGREFSSVEVLIDANPQSASVVGSTKIDGINSRINFREPMRKEARDQRLREVVARLDDEDRKVLGYDLRPVITGPITIKITQDGESEYHEIDFKDAVVELPWVGWRKGSGIPAKGSYQIKNEDNRYELKNFKLAGNGFEGAGRLIFSKNRLVFADIERLKLNETDDMTVKVEHRDNTYFINASGLSVDVRGIINKVIYEAEFKEAQGDRSVNLVANFGEVRGFQNRVIEDAIVLYESRNGYMTKLDLKGRSGSSSVYEIRANRQENNTIFGIGTNNAGNALAFANIYSKMESGKLEARLARQDDGPFVGPVRISAFKVINEPRLEKMVSSVRRQVREESGRRAVVFPEQTDKRVKFLLAEANIRKGSGFLEVADGILRSETVGLTLSGSLYDTSDRMDLQGTFMPANGLNIAVSAIPFLGQLFSNGKDNALIGITYRLTGPYENPALEINPLSIVAPGVFNKVFEFQ